MARSSRIVLLVSLAAASCGLCATTHGIAQEPPRGDSAELLQDRAPKGRQERRAIAPSRIPAVPRYAAPPGAGAGKTGFVSTNRKRAAQQRRRTAISPIHVANKSAPETESRRAAGPVMAASQHLRRRRILEADPFAPIGANTGAFLLLSALEMKAGHDSNPGRSSNGRGSPVTIVAPELLFRSLWPRHEVSGVLRGGFTQYDRFSELEGREFDGKLIGRLDVSRNTRLDLDARTRIESVSPTTPDLPSDLAKRPLRSIHGFSLGGAHRFNRLEVALKGSFDQVRWADSHLTDGSRVSNAERNYAEHGMLLRGSYEVLPGVKPFLEGGLDTREHELAFDQAGIARNSHGALIKAGTTFELTRKLTGEVAIGHIVRTYKDPTLPDLRGLLVDASLIWSASALTSLKLAAKTAVDESISPGVSGTLVRDAWLEVEHAFRRWLIGSLRFGYGMDTFAGSVREDERYLLGATLTYKMSRHAQLKGEARREWRTSNVFGNDYAATIVLGGIRLQH